MDHANHTTDAYVEVRKRTPFVVDALKLSFRAFCIRFASNNCS